MRVLRAADHRRMPWRNGGGETIEIAVSPEGAGLDDFDWRVSMARVEGDGPFSAFPGVDRTLTILGGDGLRLTIGDAPEIDLVAGSDPLFFPADVPTASRLIGGPVTDLNVMTRRAVRRHSVRRLDIVGSEVVATIGGLLVCRSGALRLTGPDGEADVSERDAVLLDGPMTLTVAAAAGPAGAILVEIARA